MRRPRTPPSSRARARTVAAGAVLVAVALAGACSGGGSAPSRAAATTTSPPPAAVPVTAPVDSRITVTDASCGAGWKAPTAGVRTFSATSRASTVVEVELSVVGPSPEHVYAQIETLAPHTTRTVTARIGPGRYLWTCTPPDGDPRSSPIETVRGTGRSGRSFVPVSTNEMLSALLAVQGSTQSGLAPLVRDTGALLAAARSGDRAAAEAAWLPAHLDYERLGDAYDSFGDLADAIDGRPSGLPRGVADPGWRGFLRLEYALWHGQPMGTVARVAATLDRDVHALAIGFPITAAAPNDLPIRVHEILENALQFQLTGQDDEGSHTVLATVRANVDGTRAALAAVTGLLQARDPAIVTAGTADLDRLVTLLDGYHRSDGSWTPLDALTRSQREHLDAQVSQTVEALAAIPPVLELSKDQG